MTYEDFEKFVRERCMYETIYDDSDGRPILVIRLLDAYGMVNKAAAAEREWQGLTDEDRQEIERWIEFKEAGGNEPVPAQKIVTYVEAKLREKNNAV